MASCRGRNEDHARPASELSNQSRATIKNASLGSLFQVPAHLIVGYEISAAGAAISRIGGPDCIRKGQRSRLRWSFELIIALDDL